MSTTIVTVTDQRGGEVELYTSDGRFVLFAKLKGEEKGVKVDLSPESIEELQLGLRVMERFHDPARDPNKPIVIDRSRRYAMTFRVVVAEAGASDALIAMQDAFNEHPGVVEYDCVEGPLPVE